MINTQDNQLILEIGSKTMQVNVVAKDMDVSPVLVNERMMLPVRYAVEAFGANVAYEEGKVIIDLEF